MFTVDPNITELNLKKKTIVRMFFSMNVHQVATPEMMLEDARSYVIFFREGKERFSAYIALHLLSTNRSLYYSHSSNAFLNEEMEGVQDDAFAFAESLGAMLDEINFSKMSEEAQHTWIDEQDIFSEKKRVETRPTPQHESVEDAGPAAPVTQPAHAPVQQQAEAQPVVPKQHLEKEPVVPPQQPVQAAQVTTFVQESLVPEPQQPVQTPHPPAIPPVPEPEHTVHAAYAPVIVVEETPVSEPQQPAQPRQETATVTQAPQTPKAQKASAPPPRPAVQAPQQTMRPKTSQQPKQQPQPSPDKLQQEIMEMAIKAGIAKSPKKTQTVEQRPVAGLVSRDREALARLLTSF
jgi:hypothetical protein